MSTAVAGVPPACGGFGGSGKKGSEPEDVGKRRRDGFFIEEEEEAGALTESSSIGAPSPASSSIGENSSTEAVGKVEGEQEEVESKLREEEKEEEGLGSLDSLEDSLPIKRGLSNFYAGKSKSFTSLAEAAATAAVKELAKPENPLNKRRRILTAWSRRASCSSLVTTYLPPLLAPDHAVAEEDEEEEDSDNEEDLQQHKYKYNNHQNNKNNKKKDVPTFPPPMLNAHTQMGMMVRNGTFRSPRSFSLSDLQNTSHN